MSADKQVSEEIEYQRKAISELASVLEKLVAWSTDLGQHNQLPLLEQITDAKLWLMKAGRK